MSSAQRLLQNTPKTPQSKHIKKQMHQCAVHKHMGKYLPRMK